MINRLLQRAVLELGQRYRSVIVLRYFEGKSLSESAKSP
jgi:DNA-directed RNA polymerase specialized sigma24 family protein